MLVTLDACCRGSEHIKVDKPLQDCSKAIPNKFKNYAVALVADGHGGDKYFRSASGSCIAVSSSIQAINEVLKGLLIHIKKKETYVIDKTLQNLCSRILCLWQEKVKENFQNNPLTADETELCEQLKLVIPLSEEKVLTLYGSTLLCAVYLEKYQFWFVLQIGDGKCILLKNEDTVSYPIPEDEKLGFGVTTSLCGKSASENFHFSYGFERINGLAVMSDGLTDSFETDKLPEFILNIKKNALMDLETTKNELDAFLPKLSEQGSGDDISLACIFSKEK